MTACVGQFTQRNTTGQLCWLEDRMVDHRNVMTKLKNYLGGRQEIEDADVYSGRRHMKSMCYLDGGKRQIRCRY